MTAKSKLNASSYQKSKQIYALKNVSFCKQSKREDEQEDKKANKHHMDKQQAKVMVAISKLTIEGDVGAKKDLNPSKTKE